MHHRRAGRPRVLTARLASAEPSAEGAPSDGTDRRGDRPSGDRLGSPAARAPDRTAAPARLPRSLSTVSTHGPSSPHDTRDRGPCSTDSARGSPPCPSPRHRTSPAVTPSSAHRRRPPHAALTTVVRFPASVGEIGHRRTIGHSLVPHPVRALPAASRRDPYATRRPERAVMTTHTQRHRPAKRHPAHHAFSLRVRSVRGDVRRVEPPPTPPDPGETGAESTPTPSPAHPV